MFIFDEKHFIVPINYATIENLELIRDKSTPIVQVSGEEKGCKLCTKDKAINMANMAIEAVKLGKRNKINAIWLEISGCFGEVISLLNADEPDVPYMLQEFVNLKYFGSIQGNEGEAAIEQIYSLLESEYIFIVCGAVPLEGNGLYTTVGTYKGKRITAKEWVATIGKNAKYIVSVGTCACYGGPTAAKPNPSGAVSVEKFLGRQDVIKVPGCPANPVWTMGILGYLVNCGMPELDNDGRPIAYYGELIHDRCPRRKYFDEGIFAKSFGDKECMFLLGCRGPVTNAYCPVSRWNSSENWPIEDNTTCIGCATPGFPDNMAPFVKYGGGEVV